MTDNQIYAILFPIIKGGLAARDIPNVTVAQSYQPTQQGAVNGRSVYLSQLTPVPRGFVRRDSVFAPDTLEMTDTELQTWEATYQVNALSIQDPNDINSLTALDILKVVLQTMQSGSTIALLRDSGLAILRVSQLRNPTFVDDKGRFEYSPSFDFTLTYDEKYVADVPAIESVEYNIQRV